MVVPSETVPDAVACRKVPSKWKFTLDPGVLTWKRSSWLKVSPNPVQLTLTCTGKEVPQVESDTSMVAVRVAAVNCPSIWKSSGAKAAKPKASTSWVWVQTSSWEI